MKRIITTLVLFISIYLLPWWLTFFVVCVSFFFFDYYVEGVIVALVLERLYSPSFNFFPNFHPALIFALVLCVFVPIVKRRLLIY